MTAETFRDALARAARSGLTVKAALPVHLNGQLCDMPALAAAARDAGVTLIEDACHALGVANVGATAHSAAACFSTHPVKAIATGEGGVVTTADAALARRMRALRSHGMVREAGQIENRSLGFDGETPNPWYYEMHEIGWNYRMPDLLCALGISQLRKLPAFFKRRQEIAARYDRLLAPLAPIVRPVPHGAAPHGWHLYAILADFAALRTTRRRFMEALRGEGIGTQVHYIPVHRQPYYRARYGDIALPGADAYYARCLSIPLYPAMTDGDAERVAGAISRLCGRTG
jgi:dTDP-4-amino-4,6-dideoxygalactose transaminase